MRISDWSSDVCSSDLEAVLKDLKVVLIHLEKGDDAQVIFETLNGRGAVLHATDLIRNHLFMTVDPDAEDPLTLRSEEHTSELKSLMRISYAVFCLKKNTTTHDKPVAHINPLTK